VTGTEILIGTITDLSGTAIQGVNSANYAGSTFSGHFLRSTSSPSSTQKSLEWIFMVVPFASRPRS
jgi:hypothetical protein